MGFNLCDVSYLTITPTGCWLLNDDGFDWKISILLACNVIDVQKIWEKRNEKKKMEKFLLVTHFENERTNRNHYLKILMLYCISIAMLCRIHGYLIGGWTFCFDDVSFIRQDFWRLLCSSSSNGNNFTMWLRRRRRLLLLWWRQWGWIFWLLWSLRNL